MKRLPAIHLFAGLMCIATIGCNPSGQNALDSDANSPTSRDPAIVDLGKAFFPIPSGWQGEGDDGGAALFPIADGNSELMISVFINDSPSTDLESQAELVAQRTGGEKILLSGGIDGEVAYRVSSPRHDEMAEEWIVVIHSGITFTISGESNDESIVGPFWMRSVDHGNGIDIRAAGGHCGRVPQRQGAIRFASANIDRQGAQGATGFASAIDTLVAIRRSVGDRLT